MFEYEGTEFTLEEVQAAAEAKGLDLNSYITKFGITKKEDAKAGKPTSQGQGAPVAETAAPEIQLTDTVSPSVDGSLELQEPIKTNIAKDTTIEIAPRLTKDQEEKILSDFEKASKINEDLEAKK